MRQASSTIIVKSRGKGLTDISDNVAARVRDSGINNGIATLFCRHTSASLLIQENASPAAHRDLEAYFERIAPDGGPL
jgi:secondary thiamine-phosphate synthase enzyme